MIRLDLNRADHWLDLMPGVGVLVRPMGSAIWLQAQMDDAVLSVFGRADADQAGQNDGPAAYSVELTKAVARRAVLDWSGVGDQDGAVLAVSGAGVDALLDIKACYEAFAAQYMKPWMGLLDEKKGSAPLPNGGLAGAQNTAAAATASAPHAPDANTAP